MTPASFDGSMSGGTKALAGAAIAAAVLVSALLSGAFGDASGPAPAAAVTVQRPAHPELRPAPPADGASSVAKKGKGKRPAITDLLTRDPVTVEAGASRIIVLSCGRSQGVAIDGGVIPPPSPAQVVVTMLSRANPNPPYANSRRNYYVGVRNLDTASASSFHASLVCAKGIDVR